MKSTKKVAEVLIGTAKGDDVSVKGTLEPLMIDGVQPRYTNKTSNLLDVPVRLFHAGRVWWLHYGKGYPGTGGFKSKKAAIHWWTHGGR